MWKKLLWQLRVKEVNEALITTADLEERYVLLEIYAGVGNLSRVARVERGHTWKVLDPIDIVYGHDLVKKDMQDYVMKILETEKPDLVTLSMPCGPWCSWTQLCPMEEIDEKRTADMPLWRFARKVWDFQVQQRGLVLTEQPWASEGLKLTFMVQRPDCWRARVAQCMLGLKDVESGKPHRKLTALDTNREDFALELQKGAMCTHQAAEHQVLEGKVKYQGAWVNRTALAGIWPMKMCRHLLNAAEKILKTIQPMETWSLAAEVGNPFLWEACAVSSGEIPEENLRRELQLQGVGSDRYGYITFEGEGQQVPRRIRNAVAHLHSALGHLANDRLVRMLMIAGAGEQILKAARNLRCQICTTVHPPRDAPQVAYNRPTNFNQRVSGDTFYVWDCNGLKFGVVHFVDALTDFHVADCSQVIDSDFTAGVLRDQWYGIFGPPDMLLTDAGMEFAGSMEVLNDLMGVAHETIPEGAKWRMGHAERHGSILKIMLMKMMKSLSLQGLDEMRMATTSATAAKNRLCNHGGVSPLQAVTGRNALIPASLMTQICSGKMKFVLNEDMEREECLQRAERIRQGAIESFHWMDAHKTLRKALASKSRPPRLELLREGATVYIYDPPANRRGLARRMQDNISWHGPATVVCVERDKRLPGRVWVRLRGRVKSVPLEKIRLATNEELTSGHFINEALHELSLELTSGNLRATEVDDLPVPQEEHAAVEEELQARLPSSSSSTTSESSEVEDMDEDKETEQMKLEKRLLDDVPLQFREKRKEDPSTLPFAKKQKLFEKLAKQMEPPTKMQEAQIRAQLEKAFDNIDRIKGNLPKKRGKVAPASILKKKAAYGVMSSPEPDVEANDSDEDPLQAMLRAPTPASPETMVSSAVPSPASYDGFAAFGTGPCVPENVGSLEDVDLECYLNRHLSEEDKEAELKKVIQNMEAGLATYGCHVSEVLVQNQVWAGDHPAAEPDGSEVGECFAR